MVRFPLLILFFSHEFVDYICLRQEKSVERQRGAREVLFIGNEKY